MGRPRGSGTDRAADQLNGLTAAIAELARRLAALTNDGESAAGEWGPLLGEMPDDGPLATLATSIGLDRVDASLLVAAAAPALDRRFAAVYAGLAGVPTVAGPAVADLLAVNGMSVWDPDARRRLGPHGRLRSAALVEVADGTALPSATVTVPERVVAGLLGDETAGAELTNLIGGVVGLTTEDVVTVARGLAAGVGLVWLRDGGHTAASVGASALVALDVPAVVLDLRRLPAGATLADVLPAAWREAALASAGIVAGPVVPQRDAAALTALGPRPIRPLLLTSSYAWDPAWSPATPLVVGPVSLGPDERAVLWQEALELAGVDAPDAPAELSTLRLGPQQIPSAVRAAKSAAAGEGAPVGINHLRAGALGEGSTKLVDLSRRIVPQATFADLVVSDELSDELRTLPGRFRTRHIVRDEWRLGVGGGRGTGLTCLFAGPSGTGKTLAAEVIANALGVDLFVIDLSQVVDKYIGETEKNLERVFVEAEGVNGVLLFDEADALFGKRAAVQSANDRHANVEVAYLLQRMERYDGVAILTTNLRGNIDEAFVRRLDVLCAFDEPDTAQRLALWRLHLPPSVPQADGIDHAGLAQSFDLAGGAIRNATISAAHAAAIERRAVTMGDLVHAVRREYRKMGRVFPAGAVAGR